ncbi:glycosyltransferase [Desulfarculus baarsii]
MSQRPLLSLCMIAKNERLWLPRSLASAAPWVDEIIVVDTGSSDETRDLARQHGAKVFEHPWQGDFALARNQSMDHASGRWLLILDADELVSADSGPRLRPALRAADGDCLLVRIEHLALDGSASWQLTPRLVRADSGLRFVGRIHEALAGGGRALAAPLTLIHHGFAQSPQITAQKARRNLELIQRWVDEAPADFSARAYLAQSLMAGAGDANQTLAAARQALAVGQAGGVAKEQLTRAYHPLMMALTTLGRLDELIETANQCLTLLPDYPDPLYSLCWAFFQMKRWSSVCRHGRRFMESQDRWRAMPQAYPFPHNLSAGRAPEVLAHWCVAAARLGRHGEATEVLGRLLGEERAEAMARWLFGRLAEDDPAGAGPVLMRLATRARPEWRWLTP